MSKDLDPPVGVSAAAVEAGNIPEIRISAADRPPGGGCREEPQAGPGPVATRTPFLSRAGRIGAAIIAYSLAGSAGWGLYGLVAPRYAGWSDFIAAKFAQMSTSPVDLLPVTQKMEGEIQALQAKVEVLQKARNATAKSLSSLEELSRRVDDAKSETKAEVGALSSRVLQFQQETNTKFAEMTAEPPAKKPRAEPAESKAAPAVEKSPERVHSWRNDAFDPSQHPTAAGAPRPLGASLDRP
jgi:prefoldin subunit 5